MKRRRLPYVAARILNQPIMVQADKLNVILQVIGGRIGLETDDDQDVFFDPPQRETAENAGADIAIIPIYGTLVYRTMGLQALSGLTSYTEIRTQFRQALADPKIARIILDIDSPGGEVAGVFDLADEIFSARGKKPIVAVANETAYSAAYLLASAADMIIIPRTAGAGSIGVLAIHVDQSGKDAQEGLRYTAIYAGAKKNQLSPHAPLSDDARSSVQNMVNETYDLFTKTVARNRGMDETAIRNTEAGIYLGENAVSLGLADMIGTMDMAVNMDIEKYSAGASGPRKEGETMSNKAETSPMTMDTLKANHPETYQAVFNEGVKSINLDQVRAETATQEKTQILSVLGAFLGEPEAEQFKKILDASLTPDQIRVLAAGGTLKKESKEENLMEKMLHAIQGAGAENPGSGGEASSGTDFMARVEAHQKTARCSRIEAIRAVARGNPDLHKEWIRKINKRG